MVQRTTHGFGREKEGGGGLGSLWEPRESLGKLSLAGLDWMIGLGLMMVTDGGLNGWRAADDEDV